MTGSPEQLLGPRGDVLRRVFEDLLDHVVASDTVATRSDDQLEQICNLLLLKLDSDKQCGDGQGGPAYFRARKTPSETAREMRRAFKELVAAYPAVFRGASDTQLRLSDSTINECVRRLSRYRLIDVGVSTMALGFQTLRAAALRQGEGQYFTPQQVIEAGVELLDIGWNDVVIDPACGTGGFLVQALLQLQRKHASEPADVARWARTHLYGIDKDAIGVKLTNAILQIAGDGSANCARGDSARTHLWRSKYPELAAGGFDEGRFSVVVTNPPFGVNLRVSAADARRSRLDIARCGGREYQDLEIGLIFLQRAHQLLKPGGRLGIILPETYFFSEGYRFVSDWLATRFAPRVVMNVPMVAFQGFCRAKTNFYLFEKIAGEDARRGKVVFLNPATCGIHKDGGPQYKVDPATGARTSEPDNEMAAHVQQHLRGESPPGMAEAAPDELSESRVLVPRYYDSRWDRPFEALCEARGWKQATLGELEQQGIIRLRGGHGSPGNDERAGHIPYVKVSDIRGLRVNINPTNMVSEAVARSFWRSDSSGLEAWDLITPNRASSNIGEFAILLPGEEQVVLTREMFVVRVTGGEDDGYSPFYLLWSLCLKAVRLQWQRVTLMQTNREDVGKRYKEVRIPAPRDKQSAEQACAAFRDYFTTLGAARATFRSKLEESGLGYIASALDSSAGDRG